MKRPIATLLVGLVAALAPDAQSTNEVFRMRGTVVSASRLEGLTLANPHRFVRLDPPQLSLTVRIESMAPQLTNYVKGSLVTFSSSGQSNLFPREAVRGATYDFVMSHKANGSASEPFELKAPPKPVNQPDGSVNRSQPVRPETNPTSSAPGSNR
jgi:hypothetical protein